MDNHFRINPDLYKKLIPFVKFLELYHSYRVVGIKNIPKHGRCIVVMNHSLATYDSILLGAFLFLKIGRSPRGLADSNFFKNPFVASMVEQIGLVEANEGNAKSLLNSEELVLIAPGGMREALRSSKDRYKVLWERRRGFVKLAMDTQSPIILAACPRADEIFDIYESFLTKFIYKNFKLPFVLLKGIGPTIIPRPVELTHYLSAPLYPPKDDTTDSLLSFHQLVEDKMQGMLNKYKNY